VATLFFSYSHADEDLRNQLETHLSSLQRQGLISAWHDRRILAGAELAPAIDKNLDKADIILLLISPDFIASNYCYEKELARAMERHRRGEARVIPVILRPCDWQDLSFGKLLATPTDGKPITTWTNTDQAFLEVARAIKQAMKAINPKSETPVASWHETVTKALGGHEEIEVVRSSNLRIRNRFSDLDRDRFMREGFEYIARFFDNSLRELAQRNPDINAAFRRVDADRFTASVYRNGKKISGGSVRFGGRTMGGAASSIR
jgi:hypothetical protein